MENRSKFYSNGLWGHDDLDNRFKHVKAALDVFQKDLSAKPGIDKEDLKFAIKNAFVSKIYVSEGVVQKYKASDFGKQAGIFNNILSGKHDVLGNNTFDICKAIGNSGKSYHTKGIRIEHVIPYNDPLLHEDIMNIKTRAEFEDIFKTVSICLVTKDEDDKLNKAGLKQIMPDEDYYKTSPFARYERARIKIHGWNIVNGNLKK